MPLLLQPARARARQQRARHRDLAARVQRGGGARRAAGAFLRRRADGAPRPRRARRATPRGGLYTNLITSGVLLDRAATRRAGRGRARPCAAQLPGCRAGKATASPAMPARTGKKRAVRRAGARRPACRSPSTRSCTARTSQQLAAMIDARRRARRRAARSRACAVLWLGARQPRRAAADRASSSTRRPRWSRRRATRLKGVLVIDYVVPDYYARCPKACMGGWGRRFLNVSPAGKVLPCHAAESLPGFDFPIGARPFSLADIWHESEAFKRFRGTDWMPRALPLLRAARDRLGRLPLPGLRADRRRRQRRSRLRAVARSPHARRRAAPGASAADPALVYRRIGGLPTPGMTATATAGDAKEDLA